MKLGFTGTRKGMTENQMSTLTQLILQYMPNEVHHGVCIGADVQFHHIIRAISKEIKIVGHPSTMTDVRGKVECDVWIRPKKPLIRNHDIVAASDILLATPKESIEVMRSGTWSTIRYARKQNVKRITIMPNGDVNERY